MKKLLDQLAARDPKYNKGKGIEGLGKKKLLELMKENLKSHQNKK